MNHKSLIVFPLLAMLVACSGLDAPIAAVNDIGREVWAEGSRPPDQWERRGINYYEPIVLMSTADWIQIKYLTVNDHAMHEEVVHLINENCDGLYTETKRQEIEGRTTVVAKCTP